MPDKVIPVEQVLERLSYDPSSGLLCWKPMPGNDRRATAWNGKCAGAVAGTVNSRGYVIISISGFKFLAHRLAWVCHYGEWPDKGIDHIDRDKTNNRIANLRTATQSENMWNTGAKQRGTSGTKGVCWDKRSRKWKVSICKHRRNMHIGIFATKEEAAAAYAEAARRYHGDFANTG